MRPRLLGPEQRWNLESYLESVARRDLVVGHTPLKLRLEVARVCNLRCVMCALGHHDPAPVTRAAFMPASLVDDLAPLLDRVVELTAFALGEPFANPELLAILRAAHRRNPGMEVFVSTNGTFLDEALARQIVEERLVTKLQISIDGATRETFEAIRPGASHARVMGNLATLLRLRDAAPGPRLWVKVEMVVMPRNAAEVLPLVRRLSELDVDAVVLDSAKGEHSKGRTLDDPVLRRGVARQIRDALELLGRRSTRLEGPLLEELVDEIDPARGAPARERAAALRCQLPWESLMVTTDGEVCLCCISQRPMGSLRRSSLAEIWNGAAYRIVRGELARGRPNERCRQCQEQNAVPPDRIDPGHLGKSLELTRRQGGPRAVVGDPSGVTGYVDAVREKAGGGSISFEGWGADVHAGRPLEEIDVVVDGRAVETLPPWIARPDVARALGLPGLLHCGFRFELPVAAARGARVLRVMGVARGGEVELPFTGDAASAWAAGSPRGLRASVRALLGRRAQGR